MLIREVMKRDFEPIQIHDTLRDAARKMKRLNTGLLPVSSAKGIIGMLSDRDLALRGFGENQAADPAGIKVGDVMSVGVLACFEDQPAAVALERMLSKRVTGIVVLNKSRNPVGSISLYDLIEIFVDTVRPGGSRRQTGSG